MNQDKQPEALRLAAWLDAGKWPSYVPQESAAALRSQHARIAELEAGLAARRVQVVPMPNDVAALVAAAQALVLDPTSHVKKLQLEAHAWGSLAAAPQPPEAGLMSEKRTTKPEAAPVQMPEAVAWMLGCQTMGGDVGWKLSWSKSGAGVCNRLNGEEFEQPLYTEHQVRQLLAAHGVK